MKRTDIEDILADHPEAVFRLKGSVGYGVVEGFTDPGRNYRGRRTGAEALLAAVRIDHKTGAVETRPPFPYPTREVESWTGHTTVQAWADDARRRIMTGRVVAERSAFQREFSERVAETLTEAVRRIAPGAAVSVSLNHEGVDSRRVLILMPFGAALEAFGLSETAAAYVDGSAGIERSATERVLSEWAAAEA